MLDNVSGREHAGVALWDDRSMFWISFLLILGFELGVLIEFSTTFTVTGSYVVLVGLLLQ